MSTTSYCNREEVAYCQPDKTIMINPEPEKKSEHKEPPHKEKGEMDEKQFMRDHSLYSAASSWLFAIAGATNIGVLGVLSSRILMASEKGQPIFKSNDPKVTPVLGNKKFNSMAIGMMVFGGACMAVSNWLESKKVLFEWQLGAGKLKRKMDNEEAGGVKMVNTNSNLANLPNTQDPDSKTPAAKSDNLSGSLQSNNPICCNAAKANSQTI